MKLGTKETKEMLLFLLGLGNALGRSLEDGKITIGDLTNLASPILDSAEAFAGSNEIPAELADLDFEEREDLLKYAKETFSVPQACCEDIIESAFDVFAEVYALVQKIKAACVPPVAK